MSAELNARRTAAVAVVADFRRESDAFIADASKTLPKPEYSSWAFRLSAELASLLSWLDDEPPGLTAADAATAVAGLTDAADYHEYRASLTCADCAAHPADLCPGHEAALDAAAAYRELAGRLSGGAA